MSERVVLLHGLGADHRAFQRFERLLPAQFDVRSLDLLGHGVGPHPVAGYGLEQHAEHIAELIADGFEATSLAGHLENPPVVCGHSYGAAVATALASEYPNLVRALVLLDPIAPSKASGTGTTRMMQAKRDGNLRATVDSVFAAESPALRRWIVETWTDLAMGVLDEFDNDWPRFAGSVQCPVTVVYGDVELGGGGPGSSELFSGAHGVRMAGAGHYVHATHARETAAVVAEAVAAAYVTA